MLTVSVKRGKPPDAPAFCFLCFMVDVREKVAV
jgi:hypothetical protein